ncbi:MAG: hypothetical protein QOI40_5145, partial [Alphaproteobacteria bacterium]|nr:hypothetical protein [Alphaproteobacteria bacterium]
NTEPLPIAETIFCALTVNICSGNLLLKQDACRVVQRNTATVDRTWLLSSRLAGYGEGGSQPGRSRRAASGA